VTCAHKLVYSHHTSPTLTSISTCPRGVDLALRTDWCVWLPCSIVDPRNYFRSFHMCIYHLKNVCDVWKKLVYSHHTSPTLTSISTYPRVDLLALRTDWCVWLPCIIVDPRKYFRSFHMCIYHLHNVCDVWKKFSLFPSYLAHPYQHQHVPTRSRLGVANRLVRMATMQYYRPA
jgi:hypothetical protein